jgi:uncharacterized protein (UPF0303 family)
MTDPQQLVAELESQQRRLVLDHFDEDDAWALGCTLVELGRTRGLPIAVDVRRPGQRLFHAALRGATADNASWIERKIRVVELTGDASYLVGRRHAATGADFHGLRGLAVADYATHGGCVPIRVRGVGVVASVTVSGLPQADDHALAVEAIEQTFGLGGRTGA